MLWCGKWRLAQTAFACNICQRLPKSMRGKANRLAEEEPVRTQLRNFLISLPERGLRSATALAGGLFRELGDTAIPRTIRRSQLYRNLVEATLRFLIEQVGQVKGVYSGEEELSEDFLVRRAAGNGIELL